MNRSTWRLNFLLTLAMLAGVLLFFELTEWDVRIQDQFFRGAPHAWVVDAKEPVGRLIFYKGIKVILVILGAAALAGYAGSFRSPALRVWRKRLLLLLLSMAIVPLTIAALKNTTNVYWPDQLERYGGDKPYVKAFASYPPGYHQTSRGHGFPAGHAAGGFSLLALFFLFRSRRARLTGFAIGMATGWAMGLYQIAKGAHFLSHTLVTMLAAWVIILLLHRIIGEDRAATPASTATAEESPVPESAAAPG